MLCHFNVRLISSLQLWTPATLILICCMVIPNLRETDSENQLLNLEIH